MADFNNAIMTTGGAALLAATTAGTARLKFAKLVTGSGSYTDQEKTRGSLQARTSLKAQKQEFPFSSITMASETCVKLVALVSNATLDTGYYVNEVGIYAVDELDADAEPVLYSIAIANVADYLPPYNGLTPSTITQEYFATVDNALEVIIQTKTGAVALAEDLAILSKEVEEKFKKVFQCGNEKKSKLVENLVAMGIEASTDETWESLLNKVLDMTDTSGDTVTADTLLSGYTAHNATGEQITGVMPDRRATTVTAAAVTQDDEYTYLSLPEGEACYSGDSKVRALNSDLTNPDRLIFNAVLGAGSFPAEIGKQYIVIAHTFYTNGNHLKPSGAIVNRIYHDMVYSGEYQADYYALITATSDKVDFGYTEWGAVYWMPIN